METYTMNIYNKFGKHKLQKDIDEQIYYIDIQPKSHYTMKDTTILGNIYSNIFLEFCWPFEIPFDYFSQLFKTFLIHCSNI